jgi:hypothetical protein
MDSNHQDDRVIRPAAFAAKSGNKPKDKLWTEADAKEASDSFKDQFVEEASLNAAQAALRVLAAAGLCDLDADDVPHIVLMLQAIKAVGCRSMGIDHPFHAVTEKIIQEPDTKTRHFVGHMVMSADGSLNNTERYFAQEGD